MTTHRAHGAPNPARVLIGIRHGETRTAQSLARDFATSTALMMELLNELIRQGELQLVCADAHTMRVHRPQVAIDSSMVITIPTPDTGVFREALTGYDATNSRLAALCMLVRRQ
ncbi:hypothetical protein [Burkholderia stagnalis]